MTLAPLVYILLLNYRGTDDTLACLDSLQALNYPNYRIIVIDNHSPDDSLSRLKARLAQSPDAFHLIESSKNLGYSGGNNLGIRYALEQGCSGQTEEQTEATNTADGFIWLLNNDTTVAPDALKALVQGAQKTGGLVGSLLRYPDGSYQQVGTRLSWWTGSSKGYQEASVHDGMAVETLTGASMLIPFKALRQVGLLDPTFFLYFEDGEFSLRCHLAGFQLTVTTNSTVYHKEGATTGRKSLPTQYYYHRNRLRMLFLFATPLQKITIGLYTIFRLLRSVVKSLTSRDSERRLSARVAARVQALALNDFRRGVHGRCPHNLESLR
jgi:GT2 family glycosyltransferase